MATGPITAIADIVVPEVFNPYVQQMTEEKSRLIASGAVVRSQQLDDDLAGGGITFNAPSFKDLDNEAENISSDEGDDDYTGGSDNSTPKKTGTATEIAVRLSRNQSWSSSDLAAALAGADPMDSIANRVSTYWARRLQAAFVATVNGIFADNDAAPSASEHVQGDLTNDVSSGGYSAGVTDFTAEAFIDAAVTMGDSMGDLSMVCVHSIVYSRMQKNNLIDFIPDSEGRVTIPTFLGRIVIVDDGVPSPSSGIYHTWLFGAGAVQLGMGAPKVPTEVGRKPDAGNGGGQDVLYNRVEWCIHPTGHAFVAAASKGGPSNAATSAQLAHADSWQRRYSERKQIKIARLITREF
jgi:hypothetical protein